VVQNYLFGLDRVHDTDARVAIFGNYLSKYADDDCDDDSCTTTIVILKTYRKRNWLEISYFWYPTTKSNITPFGNFANVYMAAFLWT
jgi:hypothetical protein